MLREQYRMHPEISRFPSRRFYQDRLIDVPSKKSSRLPAYVVLDVPGVEQVDRLRSRVVNQKEAEAVASLAKHLKTQKRRTVASLWHSFSIRLKYIAQLIQAHTLYIYFI